MTLLCKLVVLAAAFCAYGSILAAPSPAPVPMEEGSEHSHRLRSIRTSRGRGPYVHTTVSQTSRATGLIPYTDGGTSHAPRRRLQSGSLTSRVRTLDSSGTHDAHTLGTTRELISNFGRESSEEDSARTRNLLRSLERSRSDVQYGDAPSDYSRHPLDHSEAGSELYGYGGQHGYDMARLTDQAQGMEIESSSQGQPFYYFNLEQALSPNLQKLYHDLATQMTMYQSKVEERKAASPQTYKRPREYILRVDTDLDSYDDNFRVYDSLHDDQKMYIAELFLQIRAYTPHSIEKALQKRLYAKYARELLSNNVDRIEAAVEKMIPDNRARDIDYVPWMTGLSNAHRRQIMEQLADATDQRIDGLRMLFLARKISPEFALRLLHASEEQIQAIAQQNNLTVVNDGQEAQQPWLRGLSTMQIRALMQRLATLSGDFSDEAYCHAVLQVPDAPSGLGKVLLRVNDKNFRTMMHTLRSIYTILVPQRATHGE
ncbi:hypothetical protein CBS101457_000083 [Exobasidium rhododendri]|nr:hypothetical protein CBS101457_000083 [Exobasidium rhododendri]